MILFKASEVTHYFGGLRALGHFNIELAPGELVGLIGPNGAGKTTAFNCFSGIYSPTSGKIIFNNLDITGLPAHSITRHGIVRTFQNIRLFREMSCIDNIKVAARTQINYGILTSLFHPPGFWKQEHRLDDYCYGLLKMLGLHRRAEDSAGALPYGQQRRLEIARALATQPKLLLLDEPAAGMNPAETKELMDIIIWLKSEFKLTILVIEHNMQLIMKLCERIVVMNFGEIIAQGSPEQIRSDTNVAAAYLGKRDIHAA